MSAETNPRAIARLSTDARETTLPELGYAGPLLFPRPNRSPPCSVTVVLRPRNPREAARAAETRPPNHHTDNWLVPARGWHPAGFPLRRRRSIAPPPPRTVRYDGPRRTAAEPSSGGSGNPLDRSGVRRRSQEPRRRSSARSLKPYTHLPHPEMLGRLPAVAQGPGPRGRRSLPLTANAGKL